MLSYNEHICSIFKQDVTFGRTRGKKIQLLSDNLIYLPDGFLSTASPLILVRPPALMITFLYGVMHKVGNLRRDGE